MNHSHVTTAEHVMGSRTRARLLRALIFPTGQRVWVRELRRQVRTGSSSIERELAWLRGIGLVQMRRDGGAAYHEAVEGHPLLPGLRRLLDSADRLDEAGGRWMPPGDEIRRRNRQRYLEQKARRGGGAAYDGRTESEGSQGDTRVATVSDVIERVEAILGPVYLVGGSVRDSLMGRECTDFDFATPLDPDSIEEAVRRAGRRPYLMGKRFGTVAFKLDGPTIEVTTFRSEEWGADARRPSVEFLADLELDLGRRDFTINAMAMHGDRLIDPFGGREDLKGHLVRAVGDPEERFREDPLRMLRAARFVAQLDFGIDSATREAVQACDERILSVARERWMIELDRLLVGQGAGRALHLLSETGLLRYVLPELALQVRIVRGPQSGGHSLFDRTVESVVSAPHEPTARWAALLFDVATPYIDASGPDEDIERGRALLGAEIVERTALYLKWSACRREDVKRSVSQRRNGAGG